MAILNPRIQQFAESVISQKNKSITDEVFLLIQNDRNLMHEYLRLVESEGLDQVNQQIGVAVKLSYNLTNDNCREDQPVSTLIMSHQCFK
jgi:hypothetical protein